MLREVFERDDQYALSLGPGFFCFYAHFGALHALEDMGFYKPSHISGSSAGSLVGLFAATGQRPSEMVDKVLKLKREDIWDAGSSFFGLLKGDLAHATIQSHLPPGIKEFEDCPIPLAVSVWDVLGFKTKIISTGCLATAVRASCCVPLLFSPVMIDGKPHFDGGFFDEAGIMGLPGVPESKLIINIVCSPQALASSVRPEKFKDCRLLTLVLENIPAVSPFTMKEAGPRAYNVAREATFELFERGHLQQVEHYHWIAYIDGSRVPFALALPEESKENEENENNSNETTSTSNVSSPRTPFSSSNLKIPSIPSFSFIDKQTVLKSLSTSHIEFDIPQNEKNKNYIENNNFDRSGSKKRSEKDFNFSNDDNIDNIEGVEGINIDEDEKTYLSFKKTKKENE